MLNGKLHDAAGDGVADEVVLDILGYNFFRTGMFNPGNVPPGKQHRLLSAKVLSIIDELNYIWQAENRRVKCFLYSSFLLFPISILFFASLTFVSADEKGDISSNVRFRGRSQSDLYFFAVRALESTALVLSGIAPVKARGAPFKKE